jgi:hypothetical protein
MENEIINMLNNFTNFAYAIVIIASTEFIKWISIKQECGKYVLRFDRQEIVKFNIRWAVILLSFFIGVGIYFVDANTEIIDLFITFCTANVAYDYIVKLVKNRSKN